MKAHTVRVKKNRTGKWDIWVAANVNGDVLPEVLVEGGFFSKYAAEKAAGEYLTEH